MMQDANENELLITLNKIQERVAKATGTHKSSIEQFTELLQK